MRFCGILNRAGDEPKSHGKASATFFESGMYDTRTGAGGLSLGRNFSVVFMSEEAGIRRSQMSQAHVGANLIFEAIVP